MTARVGGKNLLHVVPGRSGAARRLESPSGRADVEVRAGRIDGLSDDAGISDFDPSETPILSSALARAHILSPP